MIIKSLIPARSGSKRIKDKNIKLLNDIPLLRYSIIESLHVPEIMETYVSTDEYGSLARDWGAKVIKRPKRLCGDEVGDWPVINHALKFMAPVDLIVYLRPTTPFRSSETISRAIKTLIDAKDKATGLRSVHEMSESAYKCCEVEYGFVKPICKLSLATLDKVNQIMTTTYHPNGYVDICKPDLIKAGHLWGPDIIAFQTIKVPELDTEDDWLFAEWWGQRVKVYG